MVRPKGREGRNVLTMQSPATMATVRCVALNFLAAEAVPQFSVPSGKTQCQRMQNQNVSIAGQEEMEKTKG